MIINHQVTTPAPQPAGIDLEYGFTPDEANEILGRFEEDFYVDTDETCYLVLEGNAKPYVSRYDREAVLQMWRDKLDAGLDPSISVYSKENDPQVLAQIEVEEHAERVAAYDDLVLGKDPLATPRRSLPCDQFHRSTWVLDGEEDTGARGEEWNPCEKRAVTVLAWAEEQRRELGGDPYPGLDGRMAMKVCGDDAARLLQRPGVFEVIIPGEDVMDPYHREGDLRQLRMDPQWTEATKHLDAVAAFVAQGTHNPRAYARAQSRFVGSILKLTQNHMEDTISKAVEDRFALLSHDGIEDTRVLSNRFELLRVAVNEVFQYPDLNDVVGRDTVGL